MHDDRSLQQNNLLAAMRARSDFSRFRARITFRTRSIQHECQADQRPGECRPRAWIPRKACLWAIRAARSLRKGLTLHHPSKKEALGVTLHPDAPQACLPCQRGAQLTEQSPSKPRPDGCTQQTACKKTTQHRTARNNKTNTRTGNLGHPVMDNKGVRPERVTVGNQVSVTPRAPQQSGARDTKDRLLRRSTIERQQQRKKRQHDDPPNSLGSEEGTAVHWDLFRRLASGMVGDVARIHTRRWEVCWSTECLREKRLQETSTT